VAVVQVPPNNVPFFAADGTLNLSWRKWFENVTERLGGYGGGLQPQSNVLDGLAALNASPGMLAQLDADSFTKRTLTAGTGITITNGNGSAGNPTVALTAVPGVAGVHALPTSITVNGYGQITAISP